MKRRLKFGLTLAAALTCCVQQASAETIIKFGLGEIGPDVSFDGTTFGTNDDGNAATTGDQNTRLNFVGPLAGVLADFLNATASFSLDGVVTDGAAVVIGSSVFQALTGGTFSVYDPNNNLLLSGTLASGSLQGSLTGSTGSYFNTDFATFTGGSLLPLLVPDLGGLSIALAGIVSAGGGHLSIDQNGNLLPFSANSDGLIDGQGAIPEPATVLLLLSGVVGMAHRRRVNAR